MLSHSAAGKSKNVLKSNSRPTFYLPQLDGLRFIAFFLVFLHHNLPVGSKANPFLGSHLAAGLDVLRDTCGFGLSLFFFLSAYLIGSLLILEKAKTNTIDLKAFYIRRILRIWPLYFVFVGAVSLVGIWHPAEHMSFDRLAAMALLMGNWFTVKYGLGPFVTATLWSISVEEQFYAVWPSIFRSLSAARLAIFSIVAVLASLGVIGYLVRSGASNGDIWLNSFAELIFFAGGTLLALFFQASQRPNLRVGWITIAFGLIVWVAAEFWGAVNDRLSTPSQVQLPLGYFLAACGCALLIVGCLLIPPELFPKWLTYLGKISYGLYVFHALAMHIIRSTPSGWHLRTPGLSIVLILGLTTICASISYPMLERPFLTLKRRFEAVRTRAA